MFVKAILMTPFYHIRTSMLSYCCELVAINRSMLKYCKEIVNFIEVINLTSVTNALYKYKTAGEISSLLRFSFLNLNLQAVGGLTRVRTEWVVYTETLWGQIFIGTLKVPFGVQGGGAEEPRQIQTEVSVTKEARTLSEIKSFHFIFTLIRYCLILKVISPTTVIRLRNWTSLPFFIDLLIN